ncbi:DMA protein, partial [Struthidea cinerea]|nr:DMA protein [Struthidea cinerea]
PEAQLCQEILQDLSRELTGLVPKAKGVPVVSVFPALPPLPGKPNTLVCLVENIFPPALDIGWTLAGVPVTQGVTHSPYTPTADLTFVRFSYVPVVPVAGDVHACVVTSRRDNTTVVAYWVVPDTALDEQLD